MSNISQSSDSFRVVWPNRGHAVADYHRKARKNLSAYFLQRARNSSHSTTMPDTSGKPSNLTNAGVSCPNLPLPLLQCLPPRVQKYPCHDAAISCTIRPDEVCVLPLSSQIDVLGQWRGGGGVLHQHCNQSILHAGLMCMRKQ